MPALPRLTGRVGGPGLTRAGRLAHPRRVKRSFWIEAQLLLFLLFLLCSLVAAPSAAAQPASAASKLFEEGRALAEQGKYEEACERYARSYELERAAGTMLNLGDCAEREGKLREAWVMYDSAAREFVRTSKANRAKFARDRADALAPKLATVIVRLAASRTAGLTVRIAGRSVPPEPEITERLDVGTVPVEVGAPGREPFSTTVEATVGEKVVVDVPLLRSMDGGAVVTPPPPPPPAEAPARSRRQRGRVLLAAGVSGAGAIGLGVAGLFAIRARSAYREYQDKQVELGCVETCSDASRMILDPFFDRAARRADLATGFVIGGAALAVTGAVLYLTAPRERVTVAPTAGPHTAGLSAAVRF